VTGSAQALPAVPHCPVSASSEIQQDNTHAPPTLLLSRFYARSSALSCRFVAVHFVGAFAGAGKRRDQCTSHRQPELRDTGAKRPQLCTVPYKRNLDLRRNNGAAGYFYQRERIHGADRL